MDSTVASLLSILGEARISETNVISWGSPVPSFGDASRSRVATLGLNPSNREFVDTSGIELNGESRRFHTLGSLGIARWSDARKSHVRLIVESCRAYFERNPYDAWFRQLDHIISGTEASYYDEAASACHLDLIPFATACKWTGLTPAQRSILLDMSMGALANLLRESPIQIIILNGRSVVERFQEMARADLCKQIMPDWSLRRGKDGVVAGYSYKGRVRVFADVKLRREILVLGFNHNIQSSFGVTNQIRTAIRNWIRDEVSEVGS
jgi:hypothetical protein